MMFVLELLQEEGVDKVIIIATKSPQGQGCPPMFRAPALLEDDEQCLCHREFETQPDLWWKKDWNQHIKIEIKEREKAYQIHRDVYLWGRPCSPVSWMRLARMEGGAHAPPARRGLSAALG